MPTLDLIDLELAALCSPEALAELNQHLAACPAVIDPAELLRAVQARHVLGDTCLDHEVAIPHARTSAVKRVVVAVGRSSAGVYFNPESEKVRLIFLIGVPPGLAGEYLKTVAQIARIVSDPWMRRRLLAAGVPADFQADWDDGVGLLAR